MKALTAVLGALIAVFTLLNSFGAIVSGVWLAVLGQWRLIIMGLIGLFASHFIISLLLMPQLAFGVVAMWFMKREWHVGTLVAAALSQIYLALIITGWSVAVLSIFLHNADSRAWIPAILWSYGAALGPWAYLASKEAQGGGGDGAAATTFFASLAYLTIMVMLIFGAPSLLTVASVFGAVMLLGAIAQLVVLASGMREGVAESF